MKKMNKGFSMVELIIVIAIMAILAGALAPALIRYINKSRISTDIQTGNTIATGIQTALSNEAGYDAVAGSSYEKNWTTLNDQAAWTKADKFMEALETTVGGTNPPKVKSKKCASKGGSSATGGTFDFYIDLDTNEVKVRIGGTHLVYPTADECLTDENASCSPSGT